MYSSALLSVTNSNSISYNQNLSNVYSRDKIIRTENLQNSTNKLGIGTIFYFQQDCDSKHMANIVHQWLLYNTSYILVTAPLLPDINPIEDLWKSKKYNRASKNI
ncbi:tc1-like transposase protein [Vespula squamosa]|uniref:Tc1-like transposase protein n=1 Tax=Vespula squamosa TaxID=30214 RepID=A0ABD2ADB4_VESSQ